MARKKFYYDDLRLAAKAANERMRQIEKAGVNSQAYESAQAFLRAIGVKPGKNGKYRFSESGKADRYEKQRLMNRLNRFKNAATGTVSKTKRLYDTVWNTANAKYGLADRGVSQEQYMDIWKNLPSRKKDRLFGSETTMKIVEAYNKKADEQGLTPENRLTVGEIIDEIQAASDYSNALQRVGLTYEDIDALIPLGSI